MKERPLLMSAPMVRAILDGKKTQTRRVVNHLTGFGKATEFQPSATPGYAWTFRDRGLLWQDIRADRLASACPYGQPGDRLWVREAFFDHGIVRGDLHTPTAERVEYRSDEWDRVDPTDVGGWSPSIHMPRWASRVTLELTDVRVQRVHEISEDDCRAEGCLGGHDSIPGYGFSASPLEHFTHLWDSLNAKRGYGWESNPFAWALTFKRVECAT